MEVPQTAVILAAGRGKRLKELSAHRPKPLVEINDTSILSNLVQSIIANDLKRVILVVGYKAEAIIDHLKPFEHSIGIEYVKNEAYDTTNNIYSLLLAQNYLEEGFYLFEADVYFEPKIMSALVRQPAENVMLIDRYTDRMDGTVVTCDSDSRVTEVYLKRDQGNDFDFSDKFKTVNFYRIGANFYRDFCQRKLAEYVDQDNVSSYYEAIIKEGIAEGHAFFGLQTNRNKWWEIDTREDLQIAEKMFHQVGNNG